MAPATANLGINEQALPPLPVVHFKVTKHLVTPFDQNSSL